MIEAMLAGIGVLVLVAVVGWIWIMKPFTKKPSWLPPADPPANP
jgi:uncharacterized membrane protein YphA (DoxX/SURF4 family)